MSNGFVSTVDIGSQTALVFIPLWLGIMTPAIHHTGRQVPASKEIVSAMVHNRYPSNYEQCTHGYTSNYTKRVLPELVSYDVSVQSTVSLY